MEHNRDLWPDPATARMFSAIAPLIETKKVTDAFARYEEMAVRAKKLYHYIGRAGMALVLASTLYTVADGLLLSRLVTAAPWGRTATVVAICLGLLGLLLHLWLYMFGVKDRWLVARFAAERTRSVKFAAYPLAFTASDTSALAIATDDYFDNALSIIEVERTRGRGILGRFSPEQAFIPINATEPGVNPILIDAAQRAYMMLRTNYQRDFANDQVRSLLDRRRSGEAISDFLYLAGGSLAIVALIVKLVIPDAALLSAWVDFAAMLCFILGLAKFVYDAASLESPSVDRYQRYEREVASIEQQMTNVGVAWLPLFRQMELAALTELAEFSSTLSKISYRL